MAWNGSGTFNRLFSWAQDAVNGLFISSSRMDGEFDNYKSGLENTVTRDGQNSPSANLPMAGFRHLAVGAAAARDQYTQLGQLQDGAAIWGGTAGGTANALTISLTPGILAYAAGQVFRFLTGAAANTGAATLAVNGLAAVAITRDNGVALVAGELPAVVAVQVVYTGTRFQLVADAGAVHLAGTETITGLKTFTAAPITFSGVNVFTAVKDTGSTLPAGLFGIQSVNNTFRIIRNTAAAGDFSTLTAPLFISAADTVTFNGINVFSAWKDTGSTLPAGLFAAQSVNNTFRIIRNTAAAGDFSTLTVPLVFSATDTATFVSTVAGADATAATHFLTRGQVVSTTVKNDFISLGTVTFEFPPSGWTLTRLAAGNIQVTHNLGTTNYTVVSSGSTNSRVTSLGNKLTNSFSILTFISSTLVLTDDYFAFILTKN